MLRQWAWIVTLLFCLAGCQQALSQDGAENATASSEEPATSWSLLRNDRADEFARLRSQRVDLARQLDSLQVEIRDLRDKVGQLDQQITQLKWDTQGRADRPNLRSTNLDDLEDQKASIEHRRKQELEELARRNIEMQAELDALTSKGDTLTSDEAGRMAEIKRNLGRSEDIRKGIDSDYDFQVSQLEVKIQREKDRQTQLETQRRAGVAQMLSELEDLKRERDTAADSLTKKTTDIAAVFHQIEELDTEIQKLIDVGDAEGSFKIIISLSFAALVAGVILGFYITIIRNASIVNEIFSNDSGIQFVTIFSIVIAVVLFGIIGVLGGKELSALLGGLSGYILGRSSATAKSTPAIPATGGTAKDAGGAIVT